MGLKKRILGLFLIAMMVISCIPALNRSYAAEAIESGVYDGVPWSISGNYELIIGESGNDYAFAHKETRVETDYPWNAYRDKLTKIRVEGHVNGNGSLDYMFFECKYVTSIDVTGLDTSNVTSMVYMFCGCRIVPDLDLSGFDTRNVTSFGGMFAGCFQLANLNISSFDTSNATDISGMFIQCRKLTSLDLSKFDTSKVTDMAGMFQVCQGLTRLNLSGFDTRKVTDMQYMFLQCSELTELDLSSFDTSNVKDMYGMFEDCSSISVLKIGKGFNSNTNGEEATFPVVMYDSNNGTRYDIDEKIPSVNYRTYVSSEVNPSDDGFTLDRDNNRFAHSNNNKYKLSGFLGRTDYMLDTEYKTELFRGLSRDDKLSVARNIITEWNGSCYGIAATMALVYNGILTVDDISSNHKGTYNSMELPYLDSRLDNNIDYCFLCKNVDGKGSMFEAKLAKFQQVSDLAQTMFVLEGESVSEFEPQQFLEKMVQDCKNAAESDNVLLFVYNNHCVLATGYRYDKETGNHLITLYDENTSGKPEDRLEQHTTLMTINGDYSKAEFEVASGTYEVSTVQSAFYSLDQFYLNGKARVKNMMLVDPSKIGYYGKNKKRSSDASMAKANNSESKVTKVEYQEGSSFRITNDKGEWLTVNKPEEWETKGEFSGSGGIKIADIQNYPNGNNGYVCLKITGADSDTYKIDMIDGIADQQELYCSTGEDDTSTVIDQINGQDIKLDISITNQERFTSLKTTDIESAEISADGSITIKPDLKETDDRSFSFESFIQTDDPEGNDIQLTGSANSEVNMSVEGASVNIKSDDSLIIDEANKVFEGFMETIGYQSNSDGEYIIDPIITEPDNPDDPTPVDPTPTPTPAPAVTPAPQTPAEIQDLPAVKMSKPAAAKKSVNVKWKKVTKKNLKKIQGIEIQVATDSGFTNIIKTATAGKKKTSKKIKGLISKQTYYVRIRAYKDAAGGRHVSAWKAKKVKIK